jgi:hypothetical protein
MPVPKSIQDYIHQQIAGLPDIADLVVVFDPLAALGLAETWQEESGRAWRVLRYDGNDLAFRKQQTAHPDGRQLVWVMAPAGAASDRTPRIEINSLMDVWRQADLLVDASLPGIMRKLAPTETWPEAPLWENAAVLSQNLPQALDSLHTIKRYLPRNAALDSSSIRALALSCQQPQIPAQQFLFSADTPQVLLSHYIALLWHCEWDADSLAQLQTQACQAPRFPLDAVDVWLKTPPAALALYLYLRRLLARFGIGQVANQLRGLGLFDLDTDALELHVGSILARWDKDTAWRTQLIQQAERNLSLEDAQRVIALLNLDSPAAALGALSVADTPAIVYALLLEFVRLGLAGKDFHSHAAQWAEKRPQSLSRLPETIFCSSIETLTHILDELAFVDTHRFLPLPKEQDFARLLDSYVENKLYDLEYANARAASQVIHFERPDLRRKLQGYIRTQQVSVRAYLEQWDRSLAALIQNRWSEYCGHPRLSTNVIWDAVKRRKLQPTAQARLWVVIFDGMRWDTWVRHVRPRMLETFEFVEPEKPYLSLLPSWTAIARVGLLAGKQPGGWKNFAEKFSRNQEELFAKLMAIPQGEMNRRLFFESRMESDRKSAQLDDGTPRPCNVLIYNISDDNLHSIKGDLVDLNKVVDALLEDILQSLKNLITAGDTLVIASDHGFVELDDGDAIAIPDDQRWQRQMSGDANPVRYRYLTTHEVPNSVEKNHAQDFYKMQYPGLNDRYTVAVGRRWFRRADSRSPEDRYAHGGLTFAEMTVPGAVMQRIKTKKVEFKWLFTPEKIELTEGESAELKITLTNKGNLALQGVLTLQADTPREDTQISISLLPADQQSVTYPVTGVYRLHRDGTAETTQAVKVAFQYTDENGKPKTSTKRIPVTVNMRTDKIGIDFGGLDDLDNL